MKKLGGTVIVRLFPQLQMKFIVMESRRRNMYRNSQRFNDRIKSRGKLWLKKDIKCFYCDKSGQVIKEYKILKQERSRDKGDDNKR